MCGHLSRGSIAQSRQCEQRARRKCLTNRVDLVHLGGHVTNPEDPYTVVRDRGCKARHVRQERLVTVSDRTNSGDPPLWRWSCGTKNHDPPAPSWWRIGFDISLELERVDNLANSVQSCLANLFVSHEVCLWNISIQEDSVHSCDPPNFEKATAFPPEEDDAIR